MLSFCQATKGKSRSPELAQQAIGREARHARRHREVRLVSVTLLHEPGTVANGDAPVFQLAPMAVDRAQLHHHFVGVEVERDVDVVFHDQRKQPAIAGQPCSFLVEISGLLVHREVIKRRAIPLRHRRQSEIRGSYARDVVRMPVRAVRSPSDDRLRAQPRDLLPDPLRDLLRVASVHSAVGVVPQLDAADRQRRRRRLELRGSNLREILLPGAERLAAPARLATRGADEVDRDSGAGVPQDQAATPHRLIVGMGHHDDESMGCGGLILRHTRAGIPVNPICATRGEAGWSGKPLGARKEDLPQIRTAELEAAAAALAISRVELWDYPDGGVDRCDSQEITQRIWEQITRLRPKAVVGWWPGGAYVHPDHIAVGAYTAFAVTSMSEGDRPALYHLALDQQAADFYLSLIHISEPT